MLLLVFANASQAFIKFLPEQTVGLLIVHIFLNICIAAAILNILAFYQFSKINKWVNLIPLIGIILLLGSFYLNKNNLFIQPINPGSKKVFLQPYYKDLASHPFLMVSRIALILGFLLFYYRFTIQLIKKYKSYNNLFARKLKTWIYILTISPLLIILQNIFSILNTDLAIGIWISIVIYHLNGFIFLYRPDFINRSYLKKKIFEIHIEKNEEASFNEEVFINEFYNKAYFTNPKASLRDFAESIQVSQNELSRFIKDKFGKSFNELLQEKRIELFKEISSKSEFKNFTIEALAKEAGFASRQSFYVAYKKINGGVPTDLLD